MKTGTKLPDVTFHTRVRDETIDGPNPFRWQDKTTADFFCRKACNSVFVAGRIHADMFDLSIAGVRKGFWRIRSKGDRRHLLHVRQ